jgi:glutamate 5-kinase
MRIVAKIGTASITDERGQISFAAISKLVDEAAALRAEGHELIVVSSGAVAAGVAALGMGARPADIRTLQAVSAVGQARLVQAYDHELARHDLVGAQLLVDPFDFVERTQYLHLRSTLHRLLELGVIPIVNENDAIANDELRYGDNDRIAALVANSVGADVLVLLTDMDGVYTADPRSHPDAELIPLVPTDDPLLAISAGSRGSGRGSGGMASKLTAARMASWSGIRSVIARAARPDVLAGAVSDELVGTTFSAHDRALSARKLWIAFAAEVAGRVDVDDGARRALVDRHKSLLPAGVVGVHGGFDVGDVVDVVDPSGVAFARGRVAVAAGELASVIGSRTTDLPDGMVHEVVHVDDLVVLEPVTRIGARFNRASTPG